MAHRLPKIVAAAAALALLLTLVAAAPGAAQEERAAAGKGKGPTEYQFLLKVLRASGKGSGQPLREIHLSCVEKEKTGFHFGNKVPIPTTTFNTEGSADPALLAVPRVSYSYQNIGLEFSLRVHQQAGDRVFVGLDYELSLVEDGASGARSDEPPRILSHEMSKTISLRAGEPVVVAEFFRPREGEVLATSFGIEPAAVGGVAGHWQLVLELLPPRP